MVYVTEGGILTECNGHIITAINWVVTNN